MLILAIDSTAKTAAAAICRDGVSVGAVALDAGNTHSETLLPAVEFLLDAAGVGIDEIDAFACAAGPGSFTGVRIGAATVKGLAFGRGRVCAAVDTLDALAENLSDTDGIACAVMDARRDQVYTAAFDCKDGEIRRLTDDLAVSVDELGSILSGFDGNRPIRFVGDGYDLCWPRLSEALPNAVPTPRMMRGHSAVSLARAAERAIRRGEPFVDAESLSPSYLRPSQAEREYGEKHKEI